MTQSINIADLIKPKFEVNQAVFIVRRNHNNRIESLHTAIVKTIEYSVKISKESADKEVRTPRIEYVMRNDLRVGEWQMIASLKDLEDDDHRPRL